MGGAIPFIEKSNILSNVQSVLERKPSQGMNQVIVAHRFLEDVGLGKILNMGMVIAKPSGTGNDYEIILTLEGLSILN